MEIKLLDELGIAFDINTRDDQGNIKECATLAVGVIEGNVRALDAICFDENMNTNVNTKYVTEVQFQDLRELGSFCLSSSECLANASAPQNNYFTSTFPRNRGVK